MRSKIFLTVLSLVLAGCGATPVAAPDFTPTPVVFFALTVDDYKALGLNVSDWIAASREMRLQRDFYRDCIVRSQKEVHDENLDAGLVPSTGTE
jgi:hypothetical protein